MFKNDDNDADDDDDDDDAVECCHSLLVDMCMCIVQCAYANSKAPTDMQNRPVLIWFNWKHNRIYQCVINFKISSTAFHKSYFNELNTRSLLRREI